MDRSFRYEIKEEEEYSNAIKVAEEGTEYKYE